MFSAKRLIMTVLIVAAIIASVFAVDVPVASALVPTVTMSSSMSGGHTILNISVSHTPPPTLSTTHYVNEVQMVKTNASGTSYVNLTGVQLPSTPQAQTFYLTYDLGQVTQALSISCKANCSIHGWSQAATFASTPSAPRGFTLSDGDGYIVLAWNPPASSGISAITGYVIYRGTTSGSLTSYKTLGNANTYNDTAVTNGVTYFYKVAAINSAGEGDQTVESNMTPQAYGGSIDMMTLAIIAIVIIAAIVIAIVVMRARKKPKTPEKKE